MEEEEKAAAHALVTGGNKAEAAQDEVKGDLLLEDQIVDDKDDGEIHIPEEEVKE